MRVYYVPDNVKPNEMAIGARWLIDHQREGQPVVMVNILRNAELQPLPQLKAAGVPIVIPKNFPPGAWQGGPVLAPFALKAAIDRIELFEDRITSLCIVKWLASDNEAWLRGHRATDLMQPGEPADLPLISDPVIEVAMTEISAVINLNNNLVQQNDRTDCIRRLQYLADHGFALDPDDIEAFALAHNWGSDGAANLRDIVERINQGRSFRNLSYPKIRDRGAMLKRWRERAGGD